MIFTALSKKGQIVVPKPIRDLLKLKPTDRLQVSTKNGKIIMEPILQINEVFGMFKSSKILSSKQIKDIVNQQRSKKFKLN